MYAICFFLQPIQTHTSKNWHKRNIFTFTKRAKEYNNQGNSLDNQSHIIKLEQIKQSKDRLLFCIYGCFKTETGEIHYYGP